METEGLCINADEKGTKVFIILNAIVGDNLALNEILGFQKSFSANVFCRNCFVTKVNTKKYYFEKEELIRNIHNYEAHFLQKKNSKITGIREKSIFIEMKNFLTSLNYMS
jgi:hypothetical protein